MIKLYCDICGKETSSQYNNEYLERMFDLRHFCQVHYERSIQLENEISELIEKYEDHYDKLRTARYLTLKKLLDSK